MILPLGSYCEGCGEGKEHRGKPADSLVCCHSCWRKLPRWLRGAFVNDPRRPEGEPRGATIWERRLREYLRWRYEASTLEWESEGEESRR